MPDAPAAGKHEQQDRLSGRTAGAAVQWQSGYQVQKTRRDRKVDRRDVFVIQGRNYREMAREVLRAAGVAEEIGDRSKRIGIKPNLVVAKTADSGATTHPELIDGILSYLRENGFQNLRVMEGSWVGARTEEAVRVSGILEICERHGVPFIDLQKDSTRKVDGAGMQIEVCEEALRTDYLINVPVLKGHCQTEVTCALKNGKGLIPNREKRRFHTLGLHKPIAHLNTIIHNDFILVDNLCGDLDFEEGGNPVTMNRVLGFRDPVLCDAYAANCLGYEARSIEYIRLAERLGVGSADPDTAVFHYLNKDAEKEVSFPKTGRVERLAAYTSADNGCSACYGQLIYALNRLSESGELPRTWKEKICIGQGFQGKTGKIGVGRCTAGFQETLPGCPPKGSDIVKFLRERVGK